MGHDSRGPQRGIGYSILSGLCGGLIGGGVFLGLGTYLFLQEFMLLQILGAFLQWIGGPLGLLTGCVAGVRIARGKQAARQRANEDASGEAAEVGAADTSVQTAGIIASAGAFTLAALGTVIGVIAWGVIAILLSVIDENVNRTSSPGNAMVIALAWLVAGGIAVGIPAVTGCVFSSVGILTALGSGRRFAILAITLGGVSLLGNGTAILMVLYKVATALDVGYR